VLLCISAGRNFRYDVDPTYKANRKGTRKPVAYTEVLARAKAAWPYFEHEGLEADDVLGIFGSRLQNSIICSADKDMRTIPCTLWDGKALQKITEGEANYRFMYQTLIGDTADGYPGCPSIGPKKAEALLKSNFKIGEKTVNHTIGTMWSRVRGAFEKAGLTEADALKQARLARILRNEDWDSKNKRPILWTPPT
jgi:5'-3' exonuclease